MRMDRNKGLAILLIAVGVLFLLGTLSPAFGYLMREIMSYLIPVAMIVLGYYGVRSGNMVIGWIILILGLLILIGKLSWLIGPLLAIGLIIFGIFLLRSRGRRY
ncbi:LiaF transmembrane domain-containing protein [Paenibacillus medicaginis]|uniref:LiaF transmembrane domain-containing protein n=1 Tax=Paenibacillus medicaginis TaxID=1470560 RepID=A0ABV5C889_9BACL